MKQTLPRGLRNNNPGNLRRSNDNWQGLAPEQTDPQFFQFTAPEWGYRALIKTLQTYRRKHGLQTIAELISRWAPANENNTSAYIRSVCREMQMPSTYVPDVEDKGLYSFYIYWPSSACCAGASKCSTSPWRPSGWTAST